MGFEEGVDAAQLIRAMLAELRGHSVSGKNLLTAVDHVRCTAVVDAKDCHDKVISDTSSWGSMKSLAYTVAWLKQQFRRPNIAMRWTATENMFVDAGTKDMDSGHMRNILGGGVWSLSYAPNFIKPKSKGKKKEAPPTNIPLVDLPGIPVDVASP